MAEPDIVIVVAVARNGVIGADNRLLWRLKTDLRHFRDVTWGKPLIMGRKTFESIGRPLPGRRTIVLTRDPGFAVEGVERAGSLDEALAIGRRVAGEMGADSIVVAGGGEVYAQALALADRLHVTRVDTAPDGDAVFPPVDPARFRRLTARAHPAGPDDEHAFVVEEYARIDEVVRNAPA
jgi:dihydrofolate reductase